MTCERDWAHDPDWFSVCVLQLSVSGSAPVQRSTLVTFSLLANVFSGWQCERVKAGKPSSQLSLAVDLKLVFLLTFLVPSPSISGVLDAGAQSMLGAMQTDRLKAFIWLSLALPWMQCSTAITCRSRSRFSLGKRWSNLRGRECDRWREGRKDGKKEREEGGGHHVN